MNIRAICTDIDGTLLDSKRELSARTISSIRGLKENIPVILASSRMPSAMRHLQDQLGLLSHPIICYNGGYALYFETANASPEILCNVTIEMSIADHIINRAAETDVHISLYHGDNWYAPGRDQWTDREEKITKVNATITDLLTLLTNNTLHVSGFHKIMCMGPETEIHALEQYLNEKFQDRMHVYRSRPTYIELAPKAISKATALELLLKQKFNIPMSDVMAFGDNYNDIHLLQSSGLGIAVANARPEVKAVAKEITANSVDDGVAIMIEKYLH